ncbi:amidohydrolase family protein [Bifidobacterium pullorum subsp. saeculare]|uniref:Amidohydrolase family protein n=1 Tax=Bifidobacterium pullorum subsp. saeculare TaxID=78257 RepID=A0A939B9Q4_9BIFI|nr:amidohydrolase family protein [Bifidobacterium pullorum subsp. saeculare]
MTTTYDPLHAAAHPEPLEDVTLYSAPLIIPVTGPVIVDGAVAVADGRVMHVGSRRWLRRALDQDLAAGATVRERHWRGLIMPGLINAHTHLQYTAMAAVGRGSYADFHGWERGFDEVYERLQQSDVSPWRHAAEEGAAMLVESGTTAAADIVTDPEAAGALASQGLHGIAYWEVMNWGNAQWRAEGIGYLVSQLGRMSRQGLPRIGISPHAPYTLETEPFVDLPDIARQLDMRLHIHLAETPMEAGGGESTLTTYSAAGWRDHEWDSYSQLKQAGKQASAIQFLDQLGSLGPDVHIAHGVWADAEDRRILRQRGVGVALCPRSNRITVTGRDAPIREYLEEGNLLAVGTDSLSSSPSLDVLDDLAMLHDLARGQGYDREDLTHRLIRMVTLGGAEALGMHVGAGRIGQINAGATADLAFLDVPVDVATPHGIEETLERLVCHGAGTNRATVLSGRVVHDAGALGEGEVLRGHGQARDIDHDAIAAHRRHAAAMAIQQPEPPQSPTVTERSNA